MEAKKPILIYTLRVLAEQTDETHKLSYAELAKELSALGIPCERKAIARNVAWLKDAGYEIVTDSGGSYFRGRRFEDGELRLLGDGVLANRYICAAHAKDLIGRLIKLGSRSFRANYKQTVNLDEWQRTENRQFLLNVDAVCIALREEKKISFTYNAYRGDKRLHPRTDSPCTVSPYQLFIHNQRYYLQCNRDGTSDIRFYRMDYITELSVTEEARKPASSIPNFEETASLGRVDSRFPYLYRDEIVRVELKVENDYIGEIIDWFGFDFECHTLNRNYYTVSLNAGLSGIRYWLLQYGLHVKAIGPKTLVDMLRSDTETLYRAYHETESAYAPYPVKTKDPTLD